MSSFPAPSEITFGFARLEAEALRVPLTDALGRLVIERSETPFVQAGLDIARQREWPLVDFSPNSREILIFQGLANGGSPTEVARNVRLDPTNARRKTAAFREALGATTNPEATRRLIEFNAIIPADTMQAHALEPTPTHYLLAMLISRGWSAQSLGETYAQPNSWTDHQKELGHRTSQQWPQMVSSLFARGRLLPDSALIRTHTSSRPPAPRRSAENRHYIDLSTK